jgi:hypothetical protein
MVRGRRFTCRDLTISSGVCSTLLRKDSGLTYGSDKLPAIAGIAKHFQRESSHTYVGGMWIEHIPLGSLLWRTSQCLPRPSFRGAPTWSWAAVDGKMVTGIKMTVDLKSTLRLMERLLSIARWSMNPSGHVFCR